MTSRRALGLGLAFAAGAACGWLVARETDDAATSAAAPGPHAPGGDAGSGGGPDAGASANSASSRSRARRDAVAAPGELAFPGARREASSAGPPPPSAPQPAATPEPVPPPLPPETAALVAILEEAGRSRTKLDQAGRENLRRVIEALLAADPRPSLPLRTMNGLVVMDDMAASRLLPLVPPAEVIAELRAVLAGTGAAWGSRHMTDQWVRRFAEVAARENALEQAAVDHLLASEFPPARTSAIELAAGTALLDRARLRALIRDDETGLRSVAFNHFVWTTPLGDEAAALEEVRAWFSSDRDDPGDAANMLPGLGPGGAAIAEEVVRGGGLPDSDLAPALASLILHRRLDAVPRDATQGDVGSALVGWLKGARSTHPDADTAITTFLRRSSIATDESLMDRWFELAVDAGEVQWLEVIARDRSQRAFVRAHALDRYIGELLAAGATALPACVFELVRDRTDDPAFRRMVLADILDRNYGRALACDLDLLAAVRDIAATEKNPHVRRAARDALESAERSRDSNK